MRRVVTELPHIFPPQQSHGTPGMIATAASILIPLALTAGLEVASPSLHHDVRAFVTGYNTVPGQTDSTPCIGASGANICGRRDAVACPRRISLGTVVEIRGTTYVCEDRLAKKFDSRFDISCDKDTACPYHVAGWTTIKIYGEERPAAQKAADSTPRQPAIQLTRLVQTERRPALRVKSVAHVALRLAANTISVLRGRS
jgi:hypothetical protein